MTAHRWVMLTGVSPGAGKTTLSVGLTDSLRTRGHTVDLLPEEAMFDRAEFAEAGRGFKTRRWAAAEDLLAGYAGLVAKSSRDRSIVVFDWSASAMAEDLPWAKEQAALNGHVREVKRVVASLDPVVLFLDSPVETALDRATAQRGAKWLARWAGAPNTASPAEKNRNREQVLTRIRNGSIGTERNRAAFAAADWPLVEIDASQPASVVLNDALSVVLGEGLVQVSQ